LVRVDQRDRLQCAITTHHHNTQPHLAITSHSISYRRTTRCDDRAPSTRDAGRVAVAAHGLHHRRRRACRRRRRRRDRDRCLCKRTACVAEHTRATSARHGRRRRQALTRRELVAFVDATTLSRLHRNTTAMRPQNAITRDDTQTMIKNACAITHTCLRRVLGDTTSSSSPESKPIATTGVIDTRCAGDADEAFLTSVSLLLSSSSSSLPLRRCRVCTKTNITNLTRTHTHTHSSLHQMRQSSLLHH
jgi:hypothetical protein